MLSDWDIYKSDPGVIAAIEPVTPLQGAGSLKVGRGTAPSGLTASAHLVSKGVVYAPVGVLRGALAGTFKVDTSFTSDNATDQYMGLVAVQSTRVMTGGTDTAYSVRVRNRASTGSMDMALVRHTTGLVWAAGTILWTYTLTPAIPKGTVFTLEFEWEVSTEYGGTRLIVRRGTSTTYTDLATLVDMVHPLTPLPTSSLGEGPMMLASTVATPVNFLCLIDNLRLRA